MFLQSSQNIVPSVQQAALVLNTVLLLGLLVTLEMTFAGKPKAIRDNAKYFVPIALVFVGVLVFAGFAQAGEV